MKCKHTHTDSVTAFTTWIAGGISNVCMCVCDSKSNSRTDSRANICVWYEMAIPRGWVSIPKYRRHESEGERRNNTRMDEGRNDMIKRILMVHYNIFNEHLCHIVDTDLNLSAWLYTQSRCCVFCLCHSIVVRNGKNSNTTIWMENASDENKTHART